jgi:hypothetical protein
LSREQQLDDVITVVNIQFRGSTLTLFYFEKVK